MKTITDVTGVQFMPMTCQELADSLMRTPDAPVFIETEVLYISGERKCFAPVAVVWDANGDASKTIIQSVEI